MGSAMRATLPLPGRGGERNTKAWAQGDLIQSDLNEHSL